jgi:hypothetical protein
VSDDQKAIVLDPEAQKLFEQLGGLQAFQKAAESAGAEHLAQSLLEEQRRHDAVRILMVQTAWLVSHYLADERFATNDPQEPKVFETLLQLIDRLSRTPGHLGCLLIRFRGNPKNNEIPDKCDYELAFGHTVVDHALVPLIARRNGSKWEKLPHQMLKACTLFSDYGVNNIYIRLAENVSAETPDIQLNLKIISGFRSSRQSGKPITVQIPAGTRSVPIINDENMFPDPNLTLLAGLNRLSPQAMQTLVDKVDQWLRRQQDTTAVKRYAGVYNAALELPKIRAQVRQPPIELNNVKWLVTEAEDEVVSIYKMDIAKLAMDIAGASPQQVAKMIHSIYGDDYAKINKVLLGERLSLSSHLLDAAEKSTKKEDLSKELLDNLQVRLDQVKDQIIDDVDVVEDDGTERVPGQPPSPGAVHSQIYRMVEFYKGRSGTRKKMVGMVHSPISFTEGDYEILAKDFRISIEDAQALVKKLKNCFGADGRFKKSAFTEAVEHFQRYEQKIFHFLWHHMKDVVLPPDRTAFLNALQALTTQMDQPKKAFKILLEDFCGEPGGIQFSDNKAIMLANLIIHRDKYLTDYDITPEDIVLDHHNIDAMVAQYAAWRIEKDHEAFTTKFQTIHKKMTEALHLGHTLNQQMPVAMLLNLERELFIFLSMVESETSKSVLNSAAAEYGDPGAAIYRQKESENHLSPLMQNLRVAIRGVGSVCSRAELPMLERIRANEENFGRLKNDRHFRAQARMISEWVAEAVKLIKFRA